MNWIDPIVKVYIDYRRAKLQRFKERPAHYQRQVLNYLLRKASKTQYGREHAFSEIKDYQDFRSALPIRDYESIFPYIEKALHGESDILWPGQVEMFSKSSGTTARSKYIPVTNENLRKNQLKSSWDALALLYQHAPDVGIFKNRSLVLPGSLSPCPDHPSAVAGDISAILIDQMPAIARPFYEPDFELALSPDWEEKIEKVAQRAESMKNIVLFGGVPTWNIVLFRRILELTGKDHMLEVWPQLRVYFHGGVGMGPYRSIFKEFLPDKDFIYQENYNASEGLFAIQDIQNEDLGMLLLLDNGIFYEFIPYELYGTEYERAIPLWEVEMGKTYVMVISTNSGLWRYVIGDLVQFSTIHPYRIKVTGRTKQFINAFGEELMVHNTDRAIAEACQAEDARVVEYTVAPYFMAGNRQGRHDWFIEWEVEPSDLGRFERRLDHRLRKLNSDYDAKRMNGMALSCLRIHHLPTGSFRKWLDYRGKTSSQTKVPRLSNDRSTVRELEQALSLSF